MLKLRMKNGKVLFRILSKLLNKTLMCKTNIHDYLYLYYGFQVGWDVLHQEFARLVEMDTKRGSELDEVFNKLKMTVIDSSKSTHNWDSKAEESLVSV